MATIAAYGCSVEVGFGSFAVAWGEIINVMFHPNIKNFPIWYDLPQKVVNSSPLALLKQRSWLFGFELVGYGLDQNSDTKILGFMDQYNFKWIPEEPTKSSQLSNLLRKIVIDKLKNIHGNYFFLSLMKYIISDFFFQGENIGHFALIFLKNIYVQIEENYNILVFVVCNCFLDKISIQELILIIVYNEV